MYVCMYVCVCMYISLSMYVYIYIYIYYELLTIARAPGRRTGCTARGSSPGWTAAPTRGSTRRRGGVLFLLLLVLVAVAVAVAVAVVVVVVVVVAVAVQGAWSKRRNLYKKYTVVQ